ncbi:hypothetical protein JM658_11345 [Joostella atrarenae]|uniref:Glycerophosphoryl diester phosphodiesterase membrane domain-containing protein n=1 Tax=Joostella atrarenae TaxID=679257 RepID=A0ABS9J513_9FLAO|nr:hypothetical protein [Joostella atrarenae]MCF8715423.1 hypothetical protein [Joostella atrarenae]
MDYNNILSKIEQNKPLDFGNIFGESIELFKKTWGQGVLLLLFSFILIIPAVLLLYVPFVGGFVAGAYDPEASSEVSPVIMFLFVLLFLPVMMIIQTISLGLMAGFYKVVKSKDSDIELENNGLLFFFKKEYLGKLFKLSFFSIVITILAALLCFFPLLYVSVPLAFIPLIFAFNSELSAKEILRLSFKLGNSKWLLSFGLMLVAGILAEMVGMLLCGIGILFTMSFVYLPAYFIYKKVVGFDDESEISQIGTSQF